MSKKIPSALKLYCNIKSKLCSVFLGASFILRKKKKDHKSTIVIKISVEKIVKIYFRENFVQLTGW